MLIIDNATVTRVLKMADCIRVQEEAFKKIPAGGAIHRPRIDMYMPCDRPDGYFRWGSMEGANDAYFAIRMKSDVITWPKTPDGGWTEDKYCIRPGTYCGVIYLISTRNAEPLAFINDGVLQHMRVGGGAGIGTKYLSRQDSHVVGMLGSGGMARTFLEAFACVRDIKLCKVYSPTPKNREAYAEEMSRTLGIEVRAVDNPREALRDVDIVSSATDSMQPTYDADWLQPGMHVTNLGRREMADATAARFDVVIRQGTAGLQMRQTDRFQAERGLSPAAYIGGSVEEMKRIPEKNPEPGFGGDSPEFTDRGKGGNKPDFADLITGKAKGRTSRDQITFYRNVGNQGLQFSSVGGWVYECCKREGLGRAIPTEWFLQDIRD
jgi:ornithine cyclodeaminase/alanine dehydrogenase-like protein (mu-crystallin family)